MAKLGLKDKLISEHEQKMSSLQTQLAESEKIRASITQRCEELNILVQALMQTDDKVGEASSVKIATKAMSEVIFNKDVPDEICKAMVMSLEENDITSSMYAIRKWLLPRLVISLCDTCSPEL